MTDKAEGTESAMERSAPICPTSFSSFSGSADRQYHWSSGCLGQCNKLLYDTVTAFNLQETKTIIFKECILV